MSKDGARRQRSGKEQAGNGHERRYSNPHLVRPMPRPAELAIADLLRAGPILESKDTDWDEGRVARKQCTLVAMQTLKQAGGLCR